MKVYIATILIYNEVNGLEVFKTLKEAKEWIHKEQKRLDGYSGTNTTNEIFVREL